MAKVGGVKRFSFLASLLLAASVVLSPRAAGPDDEFIRAYIQITQADNLAKSAQNSSAAAKYQEALNTLKALKSGNPGWKTGVIDFRIDYVTKKLNALNVSTPDTPTTPKPVAKPAALAEEEKGESLKEKAKRHKRTSILGNISLDETSDVPIAEQLKQALQLQQVQGKGKGGAVKKKGKGGGRLRALCLDMTRPWRQRCRAHHRSVKAARTSRR